MLSFSFLAILLAAQYLGDSVKNSLNYTEGEKGAAVGGP
jgi:hypothetical protein